MSFGTKAFWKLTDTRLLPPYFPFKGFGNCISLAGQLKLMRTWAMICESNGRVGLAMSKERQWSAIWLDQQGSPPLLCIFFDVLMMMLVAVVVRMIMMIVCDGDGGVGGSCVDDDNGSDDDDDDDDDDVIDDHLVGPGRVAEPSTEEEWGIGQIQT